MNDLDADQQDLPSAAAAMMSGKKKKSLRSIIRNGLAAEDEEETGVADPLRKRKQGGDDDIPYRDRKNSRLLATPGEDYNKHLDRDQGDDDMGQQEDEFYTKAQQAKLQRKKQRSEGYQR